MNDSVMQRICERLGRRPTSRDELTDEERQALAAVEHRHVPPIERRIVR